MEVSDQTKLSIRIVDETVKDRLREVFEDLEHRLGIEGFGVVLYSVLMELIGNAVKANLKRAFFRKHEYSLEDPESYERGLEAFKKNYREIRKEEYVRALEELELVVTVETDLDNDRFLAFVENNTIMLAEEEGRLRTKLAGAMNSDELAEFYLNYGDDMEGGGIGLAMIVFLIREIGFNPGNFRVFHRNGKTIARLEFPLHANYVPIRERQAAGLDYPFMMVRQFLDLLIRMVR